MQVFPGLFFICFISTAVILLVSFALHVQFSLPYNKAVRANVLVVYVLSLNSILCKFSASHVRLKACRRGFDPTITAIKWPADYSTSRGRQELHDFRTSSWYIDSATSPKDVVILLDSSGSMVGERRDIAKSVVSAILDTLGNNDFVNVYRFSDTTEELVPCFKDMLVQVTDTERLLISVSNMAAIGGVIRGSAISAMFEGDKHRENSALTDDCARVPDVLKDVFMKH